MKTTEEKKTELDSYLFNIGAMHSIVRAMREIAELPSEEPKDVTSLERVEFPEEGGVLTYMSGHPFPYQGFPMGDFVDKIDTIKKLSRSVVSGFYHRVKNRSILSLIGLIPAIWVFKDLLRSSIYTWYRLVERFRLKPSMYSVPIRELYRAMSIGPAAEKRSVADLRLQMRDVLCMFLEFDNAYRFRFQDIIQELDKGRLEKDTIKEILRILTIMQSREATQEVSDSWKLVKYGIKFYLKFDKEMQEAIKNFLLELNLNRVVLSEGDRYFCNPRKDYNFGFKQNNKK